VIGVLCYGALEIVGLLLLSLLLLLLLLLLSNAKDVVWEEALAAAARDGVRVQRKKHMHFLSG